MSQIFIKLINVFPQILTVQDSSWPADSVRAGKPLKLPRCSIWRTNVLALSVISRWVAMRWVWIPGLCVTTCSVGKHPARNLTGSYPSGNCPSDWCGGEATISAGDFSQAEWSTLIGPDPADTVLSLVEPYYAGTKVYAIKTQLKAQIDPQLRCVVKA